MKFKPSTVISRFIFALFMFSSTALLSQTQKVGLVLSGGGASGLAHIGVLKALEENNIPVDYITGTSMGAFVGGLYAAGYSPYQIAKIFSSPEFGTWTSGKIDRKYTHFFKKNRDDASWVRLKFSLDSILESNLPTNLINSTSLDFGMARLFAGAEAASHQDFNQLFVPFRCVASDINSKKTVAFNGGNLATAIRASISYPFFLNPVNIDGKLLYDGGLYNNFPVDEMCKEFEPDYIIGSNVSYNFPDPDEDNILSQVRSMMSTRSDYEIACEKGMIIEPPVSEYALLDFDDVQGIIQKGYESAMLKMDSIKLFVQARKSKEEFEEDRKKFNQKKPEMLVTQVSIKGVNRIEERYLLSSLRFRKNDSLNFSALESKIMKLASDEKIRRIYPELIYLPGDNAYHVVLHVKKDKKVFISFGGNLSNKAVNEGFVALQYNHLSFTPVTFYANTYFGNFYTSGYGLTKLDVPMRLPLQLYASYTYNKFDYFQSSKIFLESKELSYLIQKENFGEIGFSLPVSYKGKIALGANIGDVRYEYYQDNNFTQFDTSDVTVFHNHSYFASYQRNSLNHKQYADEGGMFMIKATYVEGTENSTTGSTGPLDTSISVGHDWLMLRARIERYFNSRRRLKFGVHLEGAWSEQPFFSNYASSILSASSFQPVPESQTTFRAKYRANQWGAVGLKSLYSPLNNLTLRLEGYMFQPYKEIVEGPTNKAEYATAAVNRYFIGSFAIVYNLPFTQIGASLNYYDNFGENFPNASSENYSIMVHLGFVLFNRKMLE